MSRALVTGAGGFIGSHLVEHLVEAGHRVRALVHYRSDGSRGWLEESPVRNDVEIVAGAVEDAGFVRAAVEGCAVVYNLAAQISIPQSYCNPERFLAVNAGGALNVLLAAREAGARVLQMSTSEVYGTAKAVPMSEMHPLGPQSPYAASKVAADALCAAFRLAYGTDVVIARPFNTYGPRQSQRSVIPNIVVQVLRGSREIHVGTVTATRDFTYVEDTVRALCMLAEDPADEEPVNIGSGEEIAVGDLVRFIGDVLGRPCTARIDGSYLRPVCSEVERLLCDNRRLREGWSWAPTMPLREGILRVAEWLRPRLGHLREGFVP